MTTNKRLGDWFKYLDFSIVGNSNNHLKNNMLLPYEDYLVKLSLSKYGLCLPGVGPKCLRDVEYMGVGTVPIFTPGVSIDYYDVLEEKIRDLDTDRGVKALPCVKLKIKCSSGTFVRSLAHELGEKLGTGGVLVSLVRSAVGSYKVENSVKIEDLVSQQSA